LTFQGDYYDGTAGQRVNVPDLSTASLSRRIDGNIDLSGGNLLFRWNRTLNEDSDLLLQFYYDRTERSEFVIEEIRDTFDIDIHHRFHLPLNNEVLWGVKFRFTTDDTNGSSILSLSETSREDPFFSAFLQDEITLIPDKLYFTLGSKIEHNNYTGIEVQPSSRILYMPNAKNSVWGAISRAVRTPSRLEHTIRLDKESIAPGTLFPGSPAALGVIIGDNNFDSEVLTAFEIGYRTQPTNHLSFDAAAFYNLYYDLLTIESGTPLPDLTIPISVRNKMNGASYGVELAARWQALEWWNIKGSYSYMDLQLHTEGYSNDTITEDSFEDDIPNHQFSIRSMMDLPGNLELDSWVRYVDSVPSVNVDSYMTLDARLGWNLTEKIELSIVGRNLLEKRHKEYGPSSIIDTQVTGIERSVYGSVTWRH
jgi:iron complex outermembrane receptor protein